jgi:hypothetical protein
LAAFLLLLEPVYGLLGGVAAVIAVGVRINATSPKSVKLLLALLSYSV